jgi:hypothetical protein
MTSITVPDAERNPDHDYITIPIVKGTYKDDIGSIEVCIQKLPLDVYREALLQGLKTIANRGMSDIKDKDNAKNRALAMEKAAQNLADLYDGKIRMSKGVRSKGLTGEIKTEAMRVARQYVKDAIKAKGGKISHYKASEITVAAQSVLDGEDGPGIVAEAKATVEARKAKGKAVKIDLTGIVADPALVEKANSKAKRKPATPKIPLDQVVAKTRPGSHATH